MERSEEMKVKVKHAGEHTGYCREYYKNIENGRLYARQKVYDGKWKWYTCTKSGEPDMPFSEKVEVEIVEGP